MKDNIDRIFLFLMDHLLEISTGWFTCALLDHLVVSYELVLDATVVQDRQRLEHLQLHDHHFYIISCLQAIGIYILWNQDWTFILPPDSSHLSPTQYCVSSHHLWTSYPDQDCWDHEGRGCTRASDLHPRRYLSVRNEIRTSSTNFWHVMLPYTYIQHWILALPSVYETENLSIDLLESWQGWEELLFFTITLLKRKRYIDPYL